MRWVDFENKKPTDTGIPGWKPWTDEEWKVWLTTSEKYLQDLQRLHEAGNLEARNQFIDAKSVHWGKLKPWLFALSHGKCWFTEGRDICSHKDVEHFRPKKEAKDIDGTIRDGYWWLAFDYSNFRACGNVPNRKKGGWFPLHPDSTCSTFDCQCEESEAPYLLDPTDPEDVNLIAFDEEGNAIPAPGISDWEAQRVNESIKRLKLNEHDDLPKERRKVWQKVSQAIELYLKFKSRTGSGKNVGAENRLREQIRIIKSSIGEEAELSSVAKWCLLFRNDPQLNRLAT